MPTSKERFLAALRGEKTDRPPFNIWMDRRLMEQFAKEHGNDPYFRINHWGADVLETFAALAYPTGPTVEETGTTWHLGPYLEDWAKADEVPLPDPNDEAVYATMRADLARFPEHAVILDMITPWGVMCSIRSFELVFTDMLDHPEEFKRLSQRIADVQTRVVERACDLGITALYLMEDVTSAQGPLMGRGMLWEFCLDQARQMAEAAQSRGVPVMFHCCGRVMDVLDELVQLDIKAVNPVQPHLNDLHEFKAKYGHSLALYGGLDNTFIIPEGPPGRIREHVLDVFNTIGRPDGRLIFSTHDIPIETHPEHIHTLVHTIVHECRY